MKRGWDLCYLGAAGVFAVAALPPSAPAVQFSQGLEIICLSKQNKHKTSLSKRVLIFQRSGQAARNAVGFGGDPTWLKCV